MRVENAKPAHQQQRKAQHIDPVRRPDDGRMAVNDFALLAGCNRPCHFLPPSGTASGDIITPERRRDTAQRAVAIEVPSGMAILIPEPAPALKHDR
jgi:hypothetical protein